MAAPAIGHHHSGPGVGELDGLGNAARMEGHDIAHALQGLGPQVVGQVVVGQVAVDALDILVRPGVKPGLVFRLQDVATAAELRAFGLGVEPRGPKAVKRPSAATITTAPSTYRQIFFLDGLMEAWKVWFAVLNNTAKGRCQFRLVAFLHYWQQFCSSDAEKPDKFELARKRCFG